MKILITGATGFIGSNIAKGLLEQGYDVYATYRNSSSFDKCTPFRNQISWINTDNKDWKDQVKEIMPDQIIHAAWGGIESGDRNNWELQLRNFWLAKEYFDLAMACQVKKIIALGSQAEYGRNDFPASEITAPKPDDAYGAVKTLSANYLRNLCDNSIAEWYWIRVFSVFGEGENSNWLMPTVISKLLIGEPIQLTSCQQKYNYLYINDFVTQILSILLQNENKSGIYNICHTESIALKDLLLKIASLMNVAPGLLQFGAIPQRQRQNMLIAGDNTKFKEQFDFDDDSLSELTTGLAKTIEYHKNRQE